MSAGYPNEDAEAENLPESLSHKDPSNLVGARVDGLVYQSRSPPEVDQVLHCHILRVRARLVQVGHFLSFHRMQIGMTEISIGKCIRGRLEPHNNGMHLRQRANQWVVDIKVDHNGGDGEGKSDVDAVSQSRENPDGVKLLPLCF